ncbi:MAG: hypothetical protein EXR53_04580 [Dehalococcoidia bacterium]|nr:hypothetical protein [Dehalococcoidia bacterium]
MAFSSAFSTLDVESYMRNLTLVLALAVALALGSSHDTLRLSPVQQLSFLYQYDFVTWEATHFPAKWLHWLGTRGFPFSNATNPDLSGLTVQTYFELQQQAESLRGELERATAAGSADPSNTELRLRALDRRLQELRPWVEEALEAAVSDTLRQEKVPLSAWKLVFPPVDFALDSLPTILITSPRDRIQRLDDFLLVPHITPRAREALEDSIARQENLSALVEGIGGISTYPAIVSSSGLREALVTASHEWLHNYLFFRPLGQSYRKDSDMSTINETTANIFGEELGDMVYARLTGEAPRVHSPGAPPEPCPQDRFCFQQEMRRTRGQAELLFAQGKVEEAEAYMEERRQMFVKNGYLIRKLNQAYFAFHGTYADSPSSVSPIYEQLLEVRRASASLGAFIHRVAGNSSRREFTDMLQRIRANQ